MEFVHFIIALLQDPLSFITQRLPQISTLFPYSPLFRSQLYQKHEAT